MLGSSFSKFVNPLIDQRITAGIVQQLRYMNKDNFRLGTSR